MVLFCSVYCSPPEKLLDRVKPDALKVLGRTVSENVMLIMSEVKSMLKLVTYGCTESDV